jgi:hypothetical protein
MAEYRTRDGQWKVQHVTRVLEGEALVVWRRGQHGTGWFVQGEVRDPAGLAQWFPLSELEAGND